MKKIVIGNLKMNLLSPAERDVYLKGMDRVTAGKKFPDTTIVLCPPFVHIEGFKKWKNRKIARGAQDVFFESKGSYTSGISPIMLKNFGCDYVIVGHSEHRKYFSESNDSINHKIIAALNHGLKPILCVGETKDEKDNDSTLAVITQQVTEALAGVNRAKANQIIIAYEPVWSVGSDVVPSANEIMGAKLLIRKILHELFDKKHAEEVAILYGGNVNVKTVKQVCIDSEVDGALVGRDSLRPSDFMKIVEIIGGKS